MAKPTSEDDLAVLHRALLPVLSRAAVGDFSGEVEIDPSRSQAVNEILMGVEVLLESIREKIAELEALNANAVYLGNPRPALLDEVLASDVQDKG